MPSPTSRRGCRRSKRSRRPACPQVSRCDRQRIHQPVDDDQYIYVPLDFEYTDAAEKFLQFLRSVVWASPEASSGLARSPNGRVLTEVTTGQS